MPPSGPTTSTMSRVAGVERRRVGERASAPSARARASGRPRPARARSLRRRERRDLGHPGADGLLAASRTIAAQRSRPFAAFGALPARDAARGRPRDDLVDAELGRGLHGELVAVALGERLHEHEPRARRAASSRATSSTAIDELARRDRRRTAPLSHERRGRRRARPSRRRAHAARPSPRAAPRRPVERHARRRRRVGVVERRSSQVEEVQRHRVSRCGSGRAASRTGPAGTSRARAPAPCVRSANCLISSRSLWSSRVGRDDLDADLAGRRAARRAGGVMPRSLIVRMSALWMPGLISSSTSPSSASIVVVVPRIASVIDTSRVASRSSPLRLKMSWWRDLDLEVEVAVRAAGRADLALSRAAAGAGRCRRRPGCRPTRCGGRARDPGPGRSAHGYGMTCRSRGRCRTGSRSSTLPSSSAPGAGSWPVPWQMSQVTGEVPGWQHEPLQVSHSTAVSTSMSRWVPKMTSSRSTSTRSRASWPRSRRERGPAAARPAAAPKNVSKMSPNPPKPPPPPPPKPACGPGRSARAARGRSARRTRASRA